MKNGNQPSERTTEALEVLAKALAKEWRDKAIAEIEPVTRERLMLKIESVARADRRRKK